MKLKHIYKISFSAYLRILKKHLYQCYGLLKKLI